MQDLMYFALGVAAAGLVILVILAVDYASSRRQERLLNERGVVPSSGRGTSGLGGVQTYEATLNSGLNAAQAQLDQRP